MTTLQAIAITTVRSIIVAMFTFIFFAFAVRTGDKKVAPHCTARSPDTIYNPKARKKKSLCSAIFCFWKKDTQKQKQKRHAQSKKSDDYDVNDRDHVNVNVPNGRDHNGNGKMNAQEDDANDPDYVQYRGGPMFGWIPWTMSLSYEQLLKGVPGTGTRKNGMEGSMLKVNMDGIVLLRYHGTFHFLYSCIHIHSFGN